MMYAAFARIQTLIDATEQTKTDVAQADYLSDGARAAAFDAIRVRLKALRDAQALFGKVSGTSASSAVTIDPSDAKRDGGAEQ